MNSMNVTGCVSITMRARLRFNFLALFVHPSCIFGYSAPLENVSKQNAFFEVNQKITQRERKCFLLWRSWKRFYSFSYASPFPFFYATNTKHHHHHCHHPHQTISVVATDLMPMASITKDHLAITTITSPHPPKPPLQSLSLLRSITSFSTTSTTIEFTCKSNTFLCESNNTKCSRDNFSCNQTYKKTSHSFGKCFPMKKFSSGKHFPPNQM